MMSEMLITLLPPTSSRDTMNCEPAASGKKLRPIPLERVKFSRGMTVAVELKGRIVKEAGALETVEFNPEKESSMGAHC